MAKRKKITSWNAKYTAHLEKYCQLLEKHLELIDRHSASEAKATAKLKPQMALKLPVAEMVVAESLHEVVPESDLDYANRAVKVSLAGIEKKIRFTPPEDEGLDLGKLKDLRLYVRGCESTIEDVDLLEATYEALSKAAEALAAAHHMAERVVVGPPAGDTSAAIIGDLEKISDEVRKDQNFSALLSLLEAAANVYAKQP